MELAQVLSDAFKPMMQEWSLAVRRGFQGLSEDHLGEIAFNALDDFIDADTLPRCPCCLRPVAMRKNRRL